MPSLKTIAIIIALPFLSVAQTQDACQTAALVVASSASPCVNMTAIPEQLACVCVGTMATDLVTADQACTTVTGVTVNGIDANELIGQYKTLCRLVIFVIGPIKNARTDNVLQSYPNQRLR